MDLKFNENHEYFVMEDDTIETGNSIIYKAVDKKLNREVAIKKVYFPDERALKQAKHEIQVLAKFSNGEVPYIYDYHVEDHYLYIMMQWIQGDSLEEKLKAKQVSSREMIQWTMDLCSILEKLAKDRVYHKDIKPGNLMIKDGKLVLIDFNISLSLSNRIEGTVGYKAPEMEQNSKNPSRDKVDMFAIGVILYEFYKGSIPKRGQDYLSPSMLSGGNEWKKYVEPIELCPNLDEKMNNIIVKCMKYNPKERYPSYSALRLDLKEVNRREKSHGRKRNA